MASKESSAPRCAALVGSYLSGKTSLLESILFNCGTVGRKGSVTEGNSVGDSAPEARARTMSVEMNIATAEYLGEQWSFIDCPGSVELGQDARSAMSVADITVVVSEPGAAKALSVGRLLRELEESGRPHMIFINKMDTAEASVAETVDALRELTSKPLILREIPIRQGEDITGYVDLASQRAYDNAEKEIDAPGDVVERVELERTLLLESLADFNDDLMEKLLEEETPELSEVFDNLSEAVQAGSVVPVIFGSAASDIGITRLLKTLRHDAPGPERTAERLGVEAGGETHAQIFKTLLGSQTGKLSVARIWRGGISDGDTLNGSRVSGMFKLLGGNQEKISKAGLGEVVALGRLEDMATGDTLSASGDAEALAWPDAPQAVYALAVQAGKREDEVKMPGAIGKLIEEDPSLKVQPNPDTHELVMSGQGETHLRIAIERLKNRNKLDVSARLPQVAYKETIRKPISQHARHKKQSGGHGQFGDVHVEIKPLPRGSGFQFTDSITGGVVPKQYIPAVETGVKEFLVRGPLGFPVVDVSVELTDGQFHAVDSSDQAFKTAGSLAMR
ncbi:MAG: elongation factor G, partial [Rhodospirillales bacterium]|nr:elongation factor G [Rhodospirillales bacterium]